MKILDRLPPRHIEGATQVLEGFVVQVASGNMARIWPAITYDPETHQTRIAFFFEWKEPVTPDDLAEVTEFTDGMMGTGPSFVTEAPDAINDERNTEWLRSGKPPKPGRVH